MGAQWAAFVGLTGLVLSAFLALARLSQHAVSELPTTQERFAPTAVDPSLGPTPPTVTAAVPDETPSFSTGALLANVALTQGLFGAILVGGAVAFSIPARAFGLDRAAFGVEPLLWGIALGIGLWIASEAGSQIVDAAGVEYDEGLRELLTPETIGGWVVLLGAVLPIIAGVEELVFRAAAIGVVGAGFGVPVWTMAVVSSFLFGIGHGAQGRAGIAVTGILGFALAAGFILSGSLLTVVVAHYLVNALAFVGHEAIDIG